MREWHSEKSSRRLIPPERVVLTKQMDATPTLAHPKKVMTMSDSHKDFIRQIIAEDIASKKWNGRVQTRFPPEPNGYLHIGHAKSICLNFGAAKEFDGQCNLRFDDTNPVKEDTEFVESIKRDVEWLGFHWDGPVRYASDYFEALYQHAKTLIGKGLAYVDDLDAESIRAYRGTLTEPGRNSPHRDRSVSENLDLFERMRAGEFPDGSRVLRARIDMAHPNITMRDPTMVRIRKAHHHRTGDAWCIYPMYDFTHCISDSIEGITHSLCTLEFENNRPLYDWFLEKLDLHHPQQIEFARLNVTHMVMSKRKLLELVQRKVVSGWDDPRMPTISGMRRRGYPAEALRRFCEIIGVVRVNSTVDFALLEHTLRDTLNRTAPRYMAVLDPIKLIITNYPEGKVELMEGVNNPEDSSAGTREIPFSRELWIERDDFRQEAPSKYFRLVPDGREVRLRYGYVVKATGFDADADGTIRCVYAEHDPATRGGNTPDGRKVKGTIHWVSAHAAAPATVRLYEHLFTNPHPEDVPEGVSWLDQVNTNSLTEVQGFVEPAMLTQKPESTVQFERNGYFCVDQDSSPTHLVVNRTVTLRDTWAKVEKKAD